MDTVSVSSPGMFVFGRTSHKQLTNIRRSVGNSIESGCRNQSLPSSYAAVACRRLLMLLRKLPRRLSFHPSEPLKPISDAVTLTRDERQTTEGFFQLDDPDVTVEKRRPDCSALSLPVWDCSLTAEAFFSPRFPAFSAPPRPLRSFPTCQQRALVPCSMAPPPGSPSSRSKAQGGKKFGEAGVSSWK